MLRLQTRSNQRPYRNYAIQSVLIKTAMRVPNSVEQKLKSVNEATRETCSLIYDKDVDRWYVFYLRAIPAEHVLGADKQVRENVGCGRTVDECLDDALRS